MLRLLDEAIEDVHLDFYAALYELTDPELIQRLVQLRGRAHVVLANGSNKKGDGNSEARKTLKKAKVDVRDRMLGSKGLGHNKFALLYNHQTGKATKCWTGSTNWSASGLCTQLNNGLLINDPKIAEIYSRQWDLLAEAGDAFTETLLSENNQSPKKAGDASVWFTRMSNPEKKDKNPGTDLKGLVKLIEGAKEMILYVMFQPGPQPLVSILLKMRELYVKGVISTLIATNEEVFHLQNIDTTSKEYHNALIQPDGIGEDFGYWLKEVTRREFLYPNQAPGIGHAITHAKMFVIDPFTDHCKVVTGSHNFSKSASEANDENFIVIEGNRELAEFYSVACLSTYEHYRYRAYLKDKKERGEEPWSHLDATPQWQGRYLSKRLISQLKLWVR
jgi:phosphatidylserine/phosphatidylglycerophosphate/cardiolipin synthase-like enzyme